MKSTRVLLVTTLIAALAALAGCAQGTFDGTPAPAESAPSQPELEVFEVEAKVETFATRDELVTYSPLIFVGQVTLDSGSNVTFVPEIGTARSRVSSATVTTRFSVRPLRAFKGSLPQGEVFFTQPGGRVADLGIQKIVGEDFLEPGQQYVFFATPVTAKDGVLTHIGNAFILKGTQAEPVTAGIRRLPPLDLNDLAQWADTPANG